MRKFLTGPSSGTSSANTAARAIASSSTALAAKGSKDVTASIAKASTAVDIPESLVTPAVAAASTSTGLDVTPSDNKLKSALTGTKKDFIGAFVTWSDNEPVPYCRVVDAFEEISNLSGRIDKENAMSKLFTAVAVSTPKNLDAVVYLASNSIYPAYEGLELGIGDSLLVKVRSGASIDHTRTKNLLHTYSHQTIANY